VVNPDKLGIQFSNRLKNFHTDNRRVILEVELIRHSAPFLRYLAPPSQGLVAGEGNNGLPDGSNILQISRNC
jgi:hypothetical protein